jgi:hypothetical protein
VVIIAIGLLGGWVPFVGSCGSLLCCMALSASEVYHLTVDKLRQVCLERGLDSSGPVRSLQQRLADHIKNGLMETSGKVDMAQAIVSSDLERNVGETAPPVLGCGSHGGGVTSRRR